VFRRTLLSITRPSDGGPLVYVGGTQEGDTIISGKVRSLSSGKTYQVKSGYLDLLGHRLGAHNAANLTNFLPGAGPGYEPLWRVRSLTLLTGERFPIERELRIISSLVGLERGGRYLDLGCSAGLYTRALGARGDAVGLDISPSMLREAARRARRSGAKVSLARADAHDLPFADASFSGAVCGGTLNELADPARALRETHRALEPGGRLAIMGILRARSPRGCRLQRLLSASGLRFFHPDELRSLLDHAGFEPAPLQTHGSVFFAGATRRR
jgi:SAM-dependent methyltransferase